MLGQIENRVANDLAGAMIRDDAAAIRFAKVDVHLRQQPIARPQVGGLSVAAERNDVRMLARQQDVGKIPALARRNHLLLQCVRRGIRNQPEIDHRAVFGWRIHVFDRMHHSSATQDLRLVIDGQAAHRVVSVAHRFGNGGMGVNGGASTAIAATGPEIISVASGPIACTPKISPYFSSVTSLMKPSCWPKMVALLLPRNGNFPTFTLNPASRACFSVSPIEPICGSQ